MNRLPVSVCIISAAEAHRIERTLASVKDWAAEIVVVLNEDVHDGTDDVAAKFGAKVFREPWKGYVAQKNSVAAKATQPWLLNIDADEVVSPELAAEIAALVQDAAAPCAAYNFPRLSFYCGRWIRHGDWYPDRVVRLWRRGQAEWGGGGLHETLLVKGTTGRLGGNLLHYSNESIEKQIAKIAPYQAAFVQERLASSRFGGFFDWVVRPWWRFMRAYFFRLGFLDGWQGFYIAALSSFSALTRLAMVREAGAKKQLTP